LPLPTSPSQKNIGKEQSLNEKTIKIKQNEKKDQIVPQQQ
jgi:hypothetical protein